jgi:ubiquitin carboxyl-terminal hydrolase 5/13
MACKHIEAPELHPPRPNQSVYREDCTQCFDSIDDPSGLNVCLYCFNGGCTGERNHASLHNQSTGHPLVLNIKRTKKTIHREEPPQKISKLAINAETEEDRYDTKTQVICYACQIENVDKAAGKLKAVVDGVMKAMTFAKQEEVKAWEQDFTPCEHTLCLEQQPSKQIESQDLGKCSMCDLKENLWLCLECGNLGCGRAQFGGVDGNSHGLAHTESTSHAVAVKLGSITPEGSADVYCYKCNEERIDTELASHLSHWGINIAEREKMEKSLMEMQVEQNLKWDFLMTTEDGQELKPLFGKGFTGLKNIGNSCYLASIIQCLFSLPNFQDRYFHPHELPPATATPADDLETQLRKLADGLISGRYSHPDTKVHASPDNPEVPHQNGLSPAMFKHLIGRGHEEFSTMRQQDAFELLLHLFKLMSLSQHPDPSQDPVKSFRFVMEQRLQCLNCRKVRYRSDEQDNVSIPVPVRRKAPIPGEDSSTTKGSDFEPVTLKECLDIFTAADVVELTCPACSSKAGFSKQSKFKTFPQNLAVNARRFELVNWVPTKLDIPVQVTDEIFDMSPYHSNGLQPGEEKLPEDAEVSKGPPSGAGFTPNAAALAQLESMGVGGNRCERALHATGNDDAEAAMNWLFDHMEDPDIDDPLVLETGAGEAGSGSVDPAKIAQLGDMGIPAPQARKALRECAGDVNRALDWVFSHPDDAGDVERSGDGEGADVIKPPQLAGSADLPARFELQSIVCHKGASIHAGHYVAFIRKQLEGEGREWVLYNDEKVVEAADVEEMKKFAYVYFFRRA